MGDVKEAIVSVLVASDSYAGELDMGLNVSSVRSALGFWRYLKPVWSKSIRLKAFSKFFGILTSQ